MGQCVPCSVGSNRSSVNIWAFFKLMHHTCTGQIRFSNLWRSSMSHNRKHSMNRCVNARAACRHDVYDRRWSALSCRVCVLGDQENVFTEHLAPDDPPVGFGEELVPLQVRCHMMVWVYPYCIRYVLMSQGKQIGIASFCKILVPACNSEGHIDFKTAII